MQTNYRINRTGVTNSSTVLNLPSNSKVRGDTGGTGHELEEVGEYLAEYTVEDECYCFKLDMCSISTN